MLLKKHTTDFWVNLWCVFEFMTLSYKMHKILCSMTALVKSIANIKGR